MVWLWIALVVAVGFGALSLWAFLGARRAQIRSKAFVSALRAVRPNPAPEQITIVPSPDADWERPSIARVAGPLIEKGFERAGVFRIAEFSGIESYHLVHRDRWCYALINRLSEPDIVFYEIDALQEDGTEIEVSSSPLLVGMPERPGKVRRHLNDWNASSAFFAFAMLCKGRTLKPIDPEGLHEKLLSEWQSMRASKPD